MTNLKNEQRIIRVNGCYECFYCHNTSGLAYVCKKSDMSNPLIIGDNVSSKILPDNCPLEKSADNYGERMSIEVVVKNRQSIVKWKLDAEYEAHLKQLLDKWGINTDCKLKRKEGENDCKKANTLQ